jgi:SAM-dependent methyltransferase
MDYERAYRDAKAYFGDGPNPFLLEHLDAIEPGGRVLDVGVGQGRNALALAERGYLVVGIDASRAAIETTRARAAERGVALDLWRGSFIDFEAAAPFHAVLLFGLLQELTLEDHQALRRKVDEWTAPGSVVFATAWHVGDPRYEEHLRSSTVVGTSSFRTAAGQLRTFFEPGRIADLFSRWRPLHHVEGLGPWHRHGDAPPERHGLIEFAARREPSGERGRAGGDDPQS